MAMAAASIGGALGFLVPRRRGVSFAGAGGARRRVPLAVVWAASYKAGVGVMATKVGMMTYFDPANGKPVPVMVVGFRDGGNMVMQVKTAATNGYDSVQVGYHGVREDKLTHQELGHLGKEGAPPLRHLQKFRLVAFDPGQELEFSELFKEGDLVDVSAKSIGKGFQAGIKRHTFKCGLMSHGSKSHRALGSIGAGTTPGRVYKGEKMPGRMGSIVVYLDDKFASRLQC